MGSVEVWEPFFSELAVSPVERLELPGLARRRLRGFQSLRRSLDAGLAAESRWDVLLERLEKK